MNECTSKINITNFEMLFLCKKGESRSKKKFKTSLWAKQTFFAYAISSDKNIVKSNFYFEFGAWKEKYLKMRVDKYVL